MHVQGIHSRTRHPVSPPPALWIRIAFAAHVEWQISEGSHGLVPVGTTGESPTLSHAEHKRVVELCIETAAKRVPVIAGAGSNNTTEAVELAQHAEKAGADAVLVVTPYYNKPTQKGLFAHFAAVAESIKLPVVIYNIPGRSVVDMSVETMAALHKAYPSIIGVKDATGKIERVSEQRLSCGAGFVQLSGEDATALGFNAHGGVGCISVTANVAPRLCAQFQEATLAGDYATALDYQDKLMPLHKALFIEPNPVRHQVRTVETPGPHEPDRQFACRWSTVEAGNRGPPLTMQCPCPRGIAQLEFQPCPGTVQRVVAKMVAENRKARFNYEIMDTFEAGLVLTGTEVKSLREGKANIAESYATEEGGRDLADQFLSAGISAGQPFQP